ncbi:MAG: hypothetical protein ISS18_10400 [Bacteroidales bacterium]|nr:hypothetical protein [Bacteroidales bacterium]
MKKLNLIGVILLFLSGAIFAQSFTVTYNFKNPQVLTAKDGYSKILYENCQNFGEEGNPSLPFLGVNLLLSQGQEIESVMIISSAYYPVKEGIKIEPAQRQFPLSQKPDEKYKVVPNAEIYNSAQPYPEKIITDISTHFLAGHSIGSFTICPLNYIPANDQVEFLQNITIEVKTHSTQKALSAELFLRSSPDIINRLDRISESPGNFAYTYPQPKDYDEYDILLITNNALLSAFDTYVEFKTATGYIVKAITIEDIYSQYSGNDNQEKIRNCIIDYYQNYGISYVILGGDSDPNNSPHYIIPHRGFYANAYGTTDTDIPADIYYSNLDGNWNNDGDNMWGEPGEDDLYSEVSIGRICVDNTTEIQNFSQKLLMYQDSPVINDIEKALMLGELLWDDPTWGGDYKDEVAYGSSNHGYTTAGVSANFTITRLYEKLASWDKYDIFNQFNNTGVNLLNHLGHSNTNYNMLMYNSDLTTTNFQNDGVSRGFVIGYSQGCYNGSFDNRNSYGSYSNDDCFAEKITTLATAEVASIGNSRYGWGMHSSTDGSSQYFDRQFYDAIFGENITNIGDANADSKEDNVSYINVGAIRWCFYELNLFGDPTMDIWTDVPTDIVATYPSSVSIGATQITFQTDAPYARIGISQNNELIGRAVAGANGNVTVTLFNPISLTDPLDVSIIAHNRNRHQGNIVIVSNQPYVIYNDHILNDPTGNNNGIADFGEDITLDMTVENVGNQNAYNVTATFISSDAYITITDNYEVYGTINASSTSTISDAFAFSIADDIPDQHVLNFELQVDGNADDTWSSYFSIVVNAPILEFGSMTIDDNAGGNGNGRLDPGETADISVPVSNNGHSLSPLAEANLSSLSSWITINSGYISLGQIVAGNTADAMFNITCDPLTPVGTAVDLTVDVTSGNYGISNTFYQSIGLVLEDWETGNFASFPWTFAGNADWFLTDVDPYEGTYCAQSGAITHYQTSEMEVELYVTTADNISFFRKVSSESSWDYLRFYIDGAQQEQWSGEVAWGQVSYPVTAGLHTFRWVYYKDGSVSSGSDCGWVDYIIFPPISPPPDPPDIEVNPESFELTLPPDDQTTQTLTISNIGDTDLDFSITKYYHPDKSSKAYCSADGGCDEYIDGVEFGDISNLSTGCNNYGDFTNLSTIVVPGNIYPITIHTGNVYSSDDYAVWVDWNENESFDDPGEEVVCEINTGASVNTFDITVPTDVVSGNKRMRVRLKYLGSDCGDPCGTTSWGEVEDYTVIVNSNFNDWLTFNPPAGTIPGSDMMGIDVTFNSTDMEDGDYYADLIISSNDPYDPEIIVPCTLEVVSGTTVNLKAFLEGPYFGGTMTPWLNIWTVLPLTQPYNTSPWNYNGTESVGSIPNANVVDWILVELRETTGDASTATPATIIAKQAGFILKNGTIVNTNGASSMIFNEAISDNLYAVIWHRNHLGIMSASALIKSGDEYNYDFTTGEDKVYGGMLGHKELEPGVWGLISGDGNADGEIQNNDKVDVWVAERGNIGYYSGDFNMNHEVYNEDKEFWMPNAGKGSKVVEGAPENGYSSQVPK